MRGRDEGEGSVVAFGYDPTGKASVVAFGYARQVRDWA